MIHGFGILLLLLLLAKNAHAHTHACADLFPFALDIGIYWASLEADQQLVWTKSCPDALAPAFDPARESDIYVHGLQPGSVRERHRFVIDDVELHPAVIAHLLLGRNVGVFQWVQFADEPLTNFIRAEGKIDATDFVGAMEYVYIDAATNETRLGDGPSVSVSQQAAEHFRAHGFQERVHLIGHSLGTQLVVYLAHKLVIETSPETRGRVDRVTMLDPVFSDSAKPYLHRNACGQDVASVLGCYMRQLLDAGVAVELYRASFINRCIFSSENNALMTNNSAAVALRLTEWGAVKDGYCWNADLLSHITPKTINRLVVQLYNQHRAVIGWYVRSGLAERVPRICIREGSGLCRPQRAAAVTALMPDSQVLMWANSDSCLMQFDDRGTRNSDPSDDLFYTEACASFNT